MGGVVRTFVGFAVGAIGFALGGPLGFAGAQLAFGLLFPAKQQTPSSFGGQLEVNTSDFDGPIPSFWGTMGAVGGNIVNVGKDKKGKPAGVLVKTKKKKVGGKGGGGKGQTVKEKQYFLVAEYAIGASGDGGPLFIDKIVMSGGSEDGDKVLWDRDTEDDTEEHKFTYTPEHSASGTLIAEHLDYRNGQKLEMWLGTEEQQAPAYMEEFWGAGEVCPHRGIAKVCFNRIKITSQPTFTFTVRAETTGRREIIKARLQACGIPDARIKLTQINGEVVGAAVLGREAAREFIEKLASRVMCGFAYNNARVEDYSKLNPHVWVLTDDDLAAREGEAGSTPSSGGGENKIHDKTPFEMKGEEEFQSEVSASFYDVDHNWDENSAIAPRLSARHSNPQNYNLPEAARLGDVLAWARSMLDEDWAADRTLEIAVLPKHSQMVPGNVMQVPHRNSSSGLTALDYLITEQGISPSGLLTFRGVPYQSGLHEQPAVITQSQWPVDTFSDLGNVYYQLFDCAPLHDSHTAQPGFYVLANWPDNVSGVEFSPTDSGTGLVSSYSSADGSGNAFPTRGTFGVAEGVLGGFSGDVASGWDDSTLILKLRGSDGVEDETDAAITSGYVNMLRVGNEIIQFVHATYLNDVPDGAGGVWHRYQISRFKRARRATEWAMTTHAAGEEVALLDNALLRVNIANFAIGQSHSYQLQHDAERGSGTQNVSFACNGRSLKPFSVTALEAVQSGGDWLISFKPRTRFTGWEINPAMPILTAAPDTDSYLVEILNDANAVLRTLVASGTGEQLVTYGAGEQSADFGGEANTLKVRVARLSNAATPEAPGGRGYETSGTFTTSGSGGGGGGSTPNSLDIYQDNSATSATTATLNVAGTNGVSLTYTWKNQYGDQVFVLPLTESEKTYYFNFPAQSVNRNLKITGNLSAITSLTTEAYSFVARIDGINACSGLQSLILSGNKFTTVNTLSGLTNLLDMNLSKNSLSQTAIEAQIDAVYVNRAALGAAGCALDWSDNPGSSGAKTSRASAITELETAGCEVSI